MNQNEMLWTCEKIAERLWTIANMMATHSAQAQHIGKGLAVVAEGTLNYYHALQDIVKEVKWNGADMNSYAESLTDLSFDMYGLGLNGMLESVGVDCLPFQVLSETLYSMLAKELFLLTDNGKDMDFHVFKAYDRPLIRLVKTQATNAGLHLLRFYTGGAPILEALEFVQEFYLIKEQEGFIENGFLNHRNGPIPIVDTGKFGKPVENPKAFVIIRTRYEKPDMHYAVPLDSIFKASMDYTGFGVAAQKPRIKMSSAFVRECWQGKEEEDFAFIDWKKTV